MNNCVSVIIPNFNDSHYLEAAIVSCLRQGPSLREIIIVDDHSTDDSLKLLKVLKQRYIGQLKYFLNPLKGGNNARNYGFSMSTGDFIQWLDADDLLCPGKFKTQLEEFKRNEGVDVVYSDWFADFYNESGELVRRVKNKKEQYADFTYEILSDNWSVPANYLLKRDLAERLHKMKAWHPQRKVAQDREYFTLAALKGARFTYVLGFYAIYNRRSKNSVSTMDFKERLGYQLLLESKFRKLIKESEYSSQKKKQYLALLNAHVMNACFYAPSLTIKESFSFLNISWNIIHYKKIPVIPFIYIWQHVKFFILKVSSFFSRCIHN